MIENIIKNIRNLCNHPWKRELLFQDKVKWEKLWVSMDAIHDTQIAIDYYSKLPDFDAHTGGYLYIYGLLQALNVQQDAINNLSSTLFDKSIDFKIEYPDLYNIREHRNNAIGHPTNRSNGKSFHLIGRAYISKKGFTLASYFPKKGEQSIFEEIDISKCIKTQENLVTIILNQVMDKLKEDFENHKRRFTSEKLADSIHNDFSYEFSKLFENIDKHYEPAQMNFKIIFDAYNKIKSGIEERYFSLEALSGIKESVRILDYIFNRLRRDLIINKIDDQIELIIIVDALKTNFAEFIEMVKEIDEEFK